MNLDLPSGSKAIILERVLACSISDSVVSFCHGNIPAPWFP